MGTRNRAFNSEVGDIEEEIPNISGTTQVRRDGTQVSKFADKFAGLDLNSFATRKTLAQGMLDLALLTANAAQLKRIMYTGPAHQFYTLLMTLIIISISLQMVQAIIMCILAIVFDLNKIDDHRRGNIANNILLMVTIVSVVINVIISTFDFVDLK
ncbi:unnamed protein product [Diamesa serratosioi]